MMIAVMSHKFHDGLCATVVTRGERAAFALASLHILKDDAGPATDAARKEEGPRSAPGQHLGDMGIILSRPKLS